MDPIKPFDSSTITLKDATPIKSFALESLASKYAGLIQTHHTFAAPTVNPGAWTGNLIIAIAAARAKYIEDRMQRTLDQIDHTQKFTDEMNNALEQLAAYAKGYTHGDTDVVAETVQHAIDSLPDGDPTKAKLVEYQKEKIHGTSDELRDGIYDEAEMGSLTAIMQDAVKEYDRDTSKKNLELQKMSNDLSQVWTQAAAFLKSCDDTAKQCIGG